MSHQTNHAEESEPSPSNFDLLRSHLKDASLAVEFLTAFQAANPSQAKDAIACVLEQRLERVHDAMQHAQDQLD